MKNNSLSSWTGTSEEFKIKMTATLIGVFFTAIGINLFYIPAGLLSGGVSGIGIIVEYLIKIPTGITMLLLNIPLLILSYFKLNRQFTFYTAVGSVMLSVFLMITRPIMGILNVNDILLASVFGGILNGVGGGILFRYGTSSGGFDIIGSYAKKYYNINVGTALMAMNGLILIMAAFIFDIEKSLYTIIAIIIGYRLVDKIQMGFGEKKQIFIMTREYEVIAKEIMNMVRGVTFLKGEGAYTSNEIKIIYTVVSTREIMKVKGIVSQHDPAAFMSISEVAEVKGEGFKSYEV